MNYRGVVKVLSHCLASATLHNSYTTLHSVRYSKAMLIIIHTYYTMISSCVVMELHFTQVPIDILGRLACVSW